MIPIPEKAEGNNDIIQLFEHALLLAKEGKLVSAALVACEKNGMLVRAMAGLPGLETQIFFGLERIKDHIKELILQREQRTPQTRNSADFVCWSLRDMPFSYDFLCALVYAEMTRIREGAPAPLKFCFYGNPARPTDYTSQFYNGVMVPALKMIGAEIDPRALHGRSLTGHNIRQIAEAARAGETVPRFKPTARLHGDFVTLTLREAEHGPHRNSNLREWTALADYLDQQGIHVIFVRDTAKAAEPIDGFATDPIAATNLEARLNLYESAKCNLFSAGGPFGLALFGSRPFLCFQHLDENDLYEPNRPSWWKEHYGMASGEQFPWSTPLQRIIPGKDAFEIMRTAWDSYYPALRAAA
jgi:hypothetical protein